MHLAFLGIGGLGFPEFLVIFAVLLVTPLTVVPACFISKKAGYAPWWGLLFAIPVVGALWLWYLGLAQWPVSRSDRSTSTPK